VGRKTGAPLALLTPVERDIELAIHHAVDLARGQGKQLAALTLHGLGDASVVHPLAFAVLSRLGRGGIEVRFESAAGPVRLHSVELDR
jgi:hypothetical protein